MKLARALRGSGSAYTRLLPSSAMRLAFAPLALTAAALSAAGCSAGGTAGPTEGIPPELTATVGDRQHLATTVRIDRVVDGDTVIVRFGGDRFRIRLLGIDTPESVKPDSPVECFGPEASERTKDLLATGSAAVVETDPGGDRQDDYGRLLAYVTPVGAAVTVNETLLREGYADLFVFHPAAPFSRVRPFRAARDAARRAGRGMWGACGRR